MPATLEELGKLASIYTQTMTSIRGRRVQRLIKREFSGADYVCIVRTVTGRSAVLGVSKTGAAWCDTDGTGKFAAVRVWSHGSGRALEKKFDLLKDSLPLQSSAAMPMTELRGLAPVQASHAPIAPDIQVVLARALATLD